MRYSNIYWDDLKTRVNATLFTTRDGVPEIHSIIQVTDPRLEAHVQFSNVQAALQRITSGAVLEGVQPIWKRFFVSDAANQSSYINDDSNTITSIVQQPPLNGTKVAVWLYCVGGNSSIKKEGNTLTVQRNGGNTHLYTTQLTAPLKDEYAETESIFDAYVKTLRGYRLSLKGNCIRTWIFVQGVDIHYKGMVKARVKVFESEGLTKETHYISSTGIEGRHVHPHSLVLMDAYAIAGVKPEQVTYLYAPTHLNRTHDYGVTFERGTTVDFADRRHVYISGTASINNRGQIKYPLNVMKQLNHTLENVTTLLHEAGCSVDDIAQMIIYLRDIADYAVVTSFFEANYPNMPKVIVLAPVCRAGWLIEVECIAIKERVNDDFPRF
jgi:enamine deaminase RidA (YjgF/YER057c/UK114 family)